MLNSAVQYLSLHSTFPPQPLYVCPTVCMIRRSSVSVVSHLFLEDLYGTTRYLVCR
jgi:hypothetical protein